MEENHLIEQELGKFSKALAEYHIKERLYDWAQNRKFIDALEEKVCRFFLEIEERNSEPGSLKYHHQKQSLYQLTYLLEAIDEAARQLEKKSELEGKVDYIKKEKNLFNRHFFHLVEHENRLKIFRPDSSSRYFFIASQLGIVEGERVSERAVAAYYVSQLLELNLVPNTIKGTYNNEPGFFQDFIEGDCFFEKKIRPLSDQEISSINKKITLPLLRDQIAQEIIGGSRFSDTYYLTAEAPFLRKIAGGPIFKNGNPISIEKAKVFLITGKIVLGKEEVASVLQVDLSRADFQKAMSDAQVFDFIIGQVDRSDANFIITKKHKKNDLTFLLSNNIKLIKNELIASDSPIKLIDHEFCFPPKFRSLDEETVRLLSQWEILIELPPLVDANTAKKVLLLNIKKMKEDLMKIGLTLEEVEASCDRLEILKNHIKVLEKNEQDGIKKIVKEWNQSTYQLLTQERKNANGTLICNNYIKRNIENMRHKKMILSLLEENKKKLSLLTMSPHFTNANSNILFWSRFS